MQKTFELELDKIDELSFYLIELLKNENYIVILRGDLASGKTTLVKNYLKALILGIIFSIYICILCKIIIF